MLIYTKVLKNFISNQLPKIKKFSFNGDKLIIWERSWEN